MSDRLFSIALTLSVVALLTVGMVLGSVVITVWGGVCR